MESPVTARLLPPLLKRGDTVRFVSPGSTPDRAAIERSARILEGWGLEVQFGAHAFHKQHYLAGPDEARLADLDAAFADPAVRAVFATRGGKGSYRIADRLGINAIRRDPKMLVGFSDITVLHLMLQRHAGLAGLHGALVSDETGAPDPVAAEAVRKALFTDDPVMLRADAAIPTAPLTTRGRASGVLVGGNLDIIATAAGWALPELAGAILLLEANGLYPGHVDRLLTMLRKAGHLTGLAGIAVGHFTGFQPSGRLTIVDLLRDHLAPLGVPILGGLPIGHGRPALPVPVGMPAVLDADARSLVTGRGL
jgi:muramoyltetrapeptide carboxypeptidase